MSASFCLDFSVTLFITESSKFSLSEKHIRRNKKKKIKEVSYIQNCPCNSAASQYAIAQCSNTGGVLYNKPRSLTTYQS